MVKNLGIALALLAFVIGFARSGSGQSDAAPRMTAPPPYHGKAKICEFSGIGYVLPDGQLLGNAAVTLSNCNEVTL